MSLASPGEPLTLADGTKIDPTTRAPVRERRVEVPRHSEAQDLVVGTRMKLRDLPIKPTDGLNTISIIVMYAILGLDDQEIAIALGCTAGQVATIRMSDSFEEMRTVLMKKIIEQDSDRVRAKIAKASVSAVERMVDLVDSESEQISLAAAKDILDRDGHRPADVVEHRHSMEGGLTITYIDRNDGDDNLPPVDLTVEVEDAEFHEKAGESDGSSSAQS